MKNLKDFNSKIDFVLTDIDDTLTTEGQLHSEAYDSLWKLHDAGLKVIPITGRPAGWCEMIARQCQFPELLAKTVVSIFATATKKCTAGSVSMNRRPAELLTYRSTHPPAP